MLSILRKCERRRMRKDYLPETELQVKTTWRDSTATELEMKTTRLVLSAEQPLAAGWCLNKALFGSARRPKLLRPQPRQVVFSRFSFDGTLVAA